MYCKYSKWVWGLDSVQVISDLVSLLTEKQLIEYAKKIGLEKSHPALKSKKFEKFQTELLDLVDEETQDREDLLRDAVLDFIFYGVIPAHGGMIFQNKVAKWLTKLDGTLVPKHRAISAQVGRKYIDIDVHVSKKHLIRDLHVWAEVKVPKIRKRDVDKLLRDAADLHRSNRDKLSNWAPDILMMVTMSGFTEDALELANQSKVYCVHYAPNHWSVQGKRPSYHFVGDMTRNHYDENVFSNYPKYR